VAVTVTPQSPHVADLDKMDKSMCQVGAALVE
jgi:hypothetical protein